MITTLASSTTANYARDGFRQPTDIDRGVIEFSRAGPIGTIGRKILAKRTVMEWVTDPAASPMGVEVWKNVNARVSEHEAEHVSVTLTAAALTFEHGYLPLEASVTVGVCYTLEEAKSESVSAVKEKAKAISAEGEWAFEKRRKTVRAHRKFPYPKVKDDGSVDYSDWERRGHDEDNHE